MLQQTYNNQSLANVACATFFACYRHQITEPNTTTQQLYNQQNFCFFDCPKQHHQQQQQPHTPQQSRRILKRLVIFYNYLNFIHVFSVRVHISMVKSLQFSLSFYVIEVDMLWIFSHRKVSTHIFQLLNRILLHLMLIFVSIFIAHLCWFTVVLLIGLT